VFRVYRVFQLTVQGVIAADVVTSDVWYSGKLLSDTVENYARLITNGSFHYGCTAEEDNATLEVLLRATVAGLVDFGRIIVMRTASDMDRQYPGQTAAENLLTNAGGFGPSIANIYLAGVKVVEGIVGNWESKFSAGIKRKLFRRYELFADWSSYKLHWRYLWYLGRISRLWSIYCR
jgi:purine nucleoside permease